MLELRICIDVDDLEAATTFYCSLFSLRVGRSVQEDWVELLGAVAPIDLLCRPTGTPTSSSVGAAALRTYARHWTPIHLDFAVSDIDHAVAKAIRAGATLEGDIREEPFGRIATLADPFGHGLCLIEFSKSGYDALPGVVDGTGTTGA